MKRKTVKAKRNPFARSERLRQQALRCFRESEWVLTDARVRQAASSLRRSVVLARESVVEAQRQFMRAIGLRPQEVLDWTDLAAIEAITPFDETPSNRGMRDRLHRLCQAAADVLCRAETRQDLVRLPARAKMATALDRATREAIDGFARFAELDPDGEECRSLVRAVRCFSREAELTGGRPKRGSRSGSAGR